MSVNNFNINFDDNNDLDTTIIEQPPKRTRSCANSSSSTKSNDAVLNAIAGKSSYYQD